MFFQFIVAFYSYIWVLKALRNFPTTKVALQIVRQSAVLRRLCGWESVANVPSESTVSRAYDQFAQDEIASLVHADFVQASLGRWTHEGLSPQNPEGFYSEAFLSQALSSRA